MAPVRTREVLESGGRHQLAAAFAFLDVSA